MKAVFFTLTLSLMFMAAAPAVALTDREKSKQESAEQLSTLALEAYECTVTLYAKLDGGGNWKFVSIGVEGSIRFESTRETCAEAVRDIKGGMAAIR